MVDFPSILSLKGKRALITGASTGLGRSIAEHFAAAGADLCLVARGKELLESTADDLRKTGRRVVTVVGSVDSAQVRDASIERCITELGGLDILVNNAGATQVNALLVDTTEDQMGAVIDTNLRVPLLLSQAAWRAYMSENGGAIVNITSFAGIRPRAKYGLYGATKAALDHFTKVLALEMAPTVRVNSVAAGLVMTERKQARAADASNPRNAVLAIAAQRPMKRFGAPDDIGKAVLFLASGASAWTTGTVMLVDGGAMLT